MVNLDGFCLFGGQFSRPAGTARAFWSWFGGHRRAETSGRAGGL